MPAHACRPLSPTTIRHIHFVLRGAYERGVRWRWVSINPVEFASPPAAKPPDPAPAESRGGGRILDEAWRDPDWGTLVWLTMTTGLRRGELCALRWSHVDLPNGTVTVRRSISQDGVRRDEKDTKTHQQRRITLDPTTVDVLTEHWDRSPRPCRPAGGTAAPGRLRLLSRARRAKSPEKLAVELHHSIAVGDLAAGTSCRASSGSPWSEAYRRRRSSVRSRCCAIGA